MLLNPYLSFNGDCEAAFRFYEKALGGKILMMMTYAQIPADANQASPDWQDKIVHARLEIGDETLMGGDSPPQHYQQPAGFSISLSIEKPEDAERVFQALSDGGTVNMPLQETFWAHRFGMFADKFGIPWMVNCEKRA
jgi:PhnB protein